jgi:hypothetical protein
MLHLYWQTLRKTHLRSGECQKGALEKEFRARALAIAGWQDRSEETLNAKLLYVISCPIRAPTRGKIMELLVEFFAFHVAYNSMGANDADVFGDTIGRSTLGKV